MSTIQCVHCQKETAALTEAPYPGNLGEKIHASICTHCWSAWLTQQTMLINENRLSLINPKAKTFLREQMNAFLFEVCTEKPEGYRPEE